jgi:hypothetical protein
MFPDSELTLLPWGHTTSLIGCCTTNHIAYSQSTWEHWSTFESPVLFSLQFLESTTYLKRNLKLKVTDLKEYILYHELTAFIANNPEMKHENRQVDENYLSTHSITSKLLPIYLFLYGSTALYGPGPPRFVEVSWSHTFETHHSR